MEELNIENPSMDENSEMTVSGGDVQYITEISVDTAQLQAELVGVNDKLTMIIVFACAALVWCVFKAIYRFIDSFF